MNPEELKARFPNASKSMIAANAEEHGPNARTKRVLKPSDMRGILKDKSVKPRRAKSMNKTEREYYDKLLAIYPSEDVKWEAYTLRMASRACYTPDFSVTFPYGRLEFHEVKGAYIFSKALVKLRIAAELFPHKFYLAQKNKTGWEVQEIPKRTP